jgi:hypothetical protein
VKILQGLGLLGGLVGLALCLVSVVARLGGTYWLAGFQVGTLMQAGIAALAGGCFMLLVFLSSKQT